MDAPVVSCEPAPAPPVRPGMDTLQSEIEALGRLDLHELRLRWRQHLRTKPPADLSRALLLRVLAYRLQARMFGDLDRDTVRYLDRIARESARCRAAGQGGRGKAPPPIPPVPGHRGLKPGTLLVREFEGRMHTATVVVGGFAWNGATYRSLSEIARLITGTRWNGPRFFGLRGQTSTTTTEEAGSR